MTTPDPAPTDDTVDSAPVVELSPVDVLPDLPPDVPVDSTPSIPAVVFSGPDYSSGQLLPDAHERSYACCRHCPPEEGVSPYKVARRFHPQACTVCQVGRG